MTEVTKAYQRLHIAKSGEEITSIHQLHALYLQCLDGVPLQETRTFKDHKVKPSILEIGDVVKFNQKEA